MTFDPQASTTGGYKPHRNPESRIKIPLTGLNLQGYSRPRLVGMIIRLEEDVLHLRRMLMEYEAYVRIAVNYAKHVGHAPSCRPHPNQPTRCTCGLIDLQHALNGEPRQRIIRSRGDEMAQAQRPRETPSSITERKG